jgi:hypothetical protein
MLILLVFIGLIVAGTWAAYTHGEGHIYIDGRTVSELEPWEVVGGVIIGIFGAIIGLAGGALGLIIGLAATVVAFALGLMGVAAGLFITAGVVLGPFLLIAAIILLMRRGQGGASGATARFDDYTDGL